MKERFFIILEVAPRNGADGYVRLRKLLKLALRVFGLKCIECREVPQGTGGGGGVKMYHFDTQMETAPPARNLATPK